MPIALIDDNGYFISRIAGADIREYEGQNKVIVSEVLAKTLTSSHKYNGSQWIDENPVSSPHEDLSVNKVGVKILSRQHTNIRSAASNVASVLQKRSRCQGLGTT